MPGSNLKFYLKFLKNVSGELVDCFLPKMYMQWEGGVEKIMGYHIFYSGQVRGSE